MVGRSADDRLIAVVHCPVRRAKTVDGQLISGANDLQRFVTEVSLQDAQDPVGIGMSHNLTQLKFHEILP